MDITGSGAIEVIGSIPGIEYDFAGLFLLGFCGFGPTTRNARKCRYKEQEKCRG
jgi:hypothetical protein